MALYAGIMSGTSLDGIDIAFADIEVVSGDPDRPKFNVSPRGYSYSPYPEDTISGLSALRSGTHLPVRIVSEYHYELGHLYAAALMAAAKENEIPLGEIAAIGLHGQTVWHSPPGFKPDRLKYWNQPTHASTLQIGEAAVLVEKTGRPVVADFRAADIVAGGQGAPLVPFADYILLSDAHETRVVLNIGGIANITYLPAGGSIADTIAFDTGPGMMIVDSVVRYYGAKPDTNGERSARGVVHEGLLHMSMEYEYFQRTPPKSTGAETFGGDYADDWARFKSGRKLDDVIATAVAFSARTIAAAVRDYLPQMPSHIILGGGGAKNKTLVRWLSEQLPEVTFGGHEEFGISSDGKEALAFAILAASHVAGIPANVPSATGAKGRRVLGAMYPGR